MTKRKLLIALTTAAVATAGFGASVIPASAEPRTFVVTLATGQSITVTVDVPPGTPVSAIKFPGVNGVVVSVVEVTPPPQPSDAPPVQVAPGAPGGADDDGGDTSAGGDAGEPRPSGGYEPRAGGDAKRQKSTGDKK